MKPADQYYTPDFIVDKMIDCVRGHTFPVIADFAAGDGHLLRAAEVVWPNSHLLANDVDRKAIQRLRRRHKNWAVVGLDFLANFTTVRQRIFDHFAQPASLALMNPPFSGRGNSKWYVEAGEDAVTCSQALAFILSAADLVAAEGHIIAVIPDSSLHSEKDRHAWKIIRRRFSVENVHQNPRRSFRGCVATTSIVHLVRLTSSSTPSVEPECAVSSPTSPRPLSVSIHRGKLPVHLATVTSKSGNYPYIHSTELRNCSIDLKARFVSSPRHVLRGPVVLFPRVGIPSKAKFVVYTSRTPIVLSDCVFGLRCATQRDAHLLHQLLMDRWIHVSSLFHGTCAPYTTVERVAAFLAHLGCFVTPPITALTLARPLVGEL